MKPLNSSRAKTSILNPAFEYTPSHASDIRSRFDAIRQQRQQRKATEAADNAVLHANFDARRRAKERA